VIAVKVNTNGDHITRVYALRHTLNSCQTNQYLIFGHKSGYYKTYILKSDSIGDKMTKICKEMSPKTDESCSSGSSDACNGQALGLSARSLSTNKVKKSQTTHKMDTNVSADEMQSLLAKLKELVPNIPRNKKLSKLEIIQYVIDYIFDLQLALDTHPQPLCQSSNNSSATSSSIASLRQPLAIKWSS